MLIQGMTYDENGRSEMVVRKQNEADESFLLKLVPMRGERLTIERLDDLTFKISRVEDSQAAAATVDYNHMSKEDLMTLCAQRGLEIPKNIRKFDLVQMLGVTGDQTP